MRQAALYVALAIAIALLAWAAATYGWEAFAAATGAAGALGLTRKGRNAAKKARVLSLEVAASDANHAARRDMLKAKEAESESAGATHLANADRHAAKADEIEAKIAALIEEMD